jgi:hypothetical protein
LRKRRSAKRSPAPLNLTCVAGGALVAYVAITFFFLAISSVIAQALIDQGIGIGWAIFLGLLIVALVIGAVSAAMIVKGVQTLKKQSLIPEKTVETLKEDKTWAQNKIH